LFTGIVYAAGINARIKDAIVAPFKGMIPFQGPKTLVVGQIERLFNIGVERIVVVIGLEHQILKDHILEWFPNQRIEFETNPDYRTKANMLSLWHARGWCSNSVCFTTSDLFLGAQLPKLFAQSGRSEILADTSVLRQAQVADAVKLQIIDGRISRVHKSLRSSETTAIAPGFYFFNEFGIDQILKDIEKQILVGLDDQSLYKVVDRVAKKHKIFPSFLNASTWVDVDTKEDLQEMAKSLENSSDTSGVAK